MSKNESDLRKRTEDKNNRGWEILRDRFDTIRQRKKLMRVTTILSCAIVFFVTYSMILPAITVEKDDAEEMPGMKVEEKATLDVETLKEGDLLQITPVEVAEGEPHIAIVVETDAESENEASVFVLEKDPEDGIQITEVAADDSTVSLLTTEEAAEYEGLEEEVLALVQAAEEEELLEPEEIAALEEEVGVILSEVEELEEDSSAAPRNDSEVVPQIDESAVVQDAEDIIPNEEVTDVNQSEVKDPEEDSSAVPRNDNEIAPGNDTEVVPQDDSFVILSEAKDLAPATETIIDAAMNGRILQQTADGITVTARWEEGVLPEGVEMIVKAVEPKDYKGLVDETLGKTRAETQSLDITFRVGDEEVEPSGNVKITFRADFIDRQASPEVVHINADGTAEVMNAKVMNDEISLTATSFSVYVIRYTVDFHWEAAGQVYSYSFQGGSYIDVQTLVEALGIGEDDPEAFVADIETIEFSNTDLVWAGKAEEDTTVGELKEANGLECQYSAELTEEEIAEINAQPVAAGTWVLISMKPFDTDEYLEVTMKNGDEWVLKVTDAQQVTDSATFKTSERFVIAYVDSGGKYTVLTSSGGWEKFDTAEDIDFLDSRYLWRFFYVFTEKNQDAPNANYEYYFIRPTEDLSKSIALIDVNDNDLIQTGANNIAVIPQGNGTYVMEGYSSVGADMPYLYFDGTNFLADGNHSTPLTIFTQDDIKKYQFTVRTADPDMGLVYGKNKDGVEQNGVEQFVTRTKDSYNNNWGAQAKANDESAGGVYRYLFDYFDLNGEIVPSDMVEITNDGRNGKIKADLLQIPYNGSILTAHFKQNPNYVGASKVESLQEWVNEIKSTNVPLDEEATKKTAEVYDYENRIYRVDLTTRSSLKSFTGTIDLGLILDVSGSMKFPSKLVEAKNGAGQIIGTKDIRTINSVTQYYYGYPSRYAWQDWGLSTSETYYVIAESSTRATVFRIFYNNDGWHRVDASKSNDDNSQELIGSGTKFGVDTVFNYPILVSGDNNANGTAVTRSYYEKKSIDDTAKTLNEVLEILNIANNPNESPDVRAAWNTFAYKIKDSQHSFVDLKSNDSLSINYETEGGTRTDLALTDALSFNWGSSNTKYAILITDGAPQFGSTNNDQDPYNKATNPAHSLDEKTDELIRRIKNIKRTYEERGIKLITVGLSLKDVPKGNQLLYDIADSINGKRMFFQAESGDELENALLEVVKTILLPCNVYGDVTDTVSEAFYLVDRETGKPLQPGDIISLDGVLTNDTSQAYGIVQSDGRTVKWTNQEFTPEGWHGTVYVKAKEDLLGGNMLPTNTGNAVFEAKKYSTRTNSDHKIAITTNTEQIVNKDKFHPIQNRVTPLVNVNELSFEQNNTDWTVYLGTEVDPKKQLEKLWHGILVEEVVKKGCAEDNDHNGLPEFGKNQEGNPWYPLDDNSIDDDREPQGSGDKQTFLLNDLIKVLAEGKNYSWWDYSKSEPKWDKFFSQALNGGITIPYDLYGINDDSNDDSNIVISLTKTIATGEEDGLEGRSPHNTTVTGEAVESYTLKVVYSPDYTVLPRGQGGSYTGDIHTGTFGTMYQGHAAGTETSTNEHVINVYSKALQITKMNELGNQALKGAEFILYRTAREDDNQEDVVHLSGVEEDCFPLKKLEMTDSPFATIDPIEAIGENEEYYLVETKSPNGYNLLPKPLKVELTSENSYTTVPEGTASEMEPPGVPYNWEQKTDIVIDKQENGGSSPWAIRTDKDGQVLTGNATATSNSNSETVYYNIKNDAGYELPETGGPGQEGILAIGGLLVISASAGLVLRRRKQLKHDR